jgi:phthalate 4,5-cis-dihydrodiol dehydrogenase
VSDGATRIAVLGWGTAGQLMATAVDRSERFRLVGVADTAESVRQRISRPGGITVTSTLGRLLAEADPDVVYVATPTAAHANVVAALAAAGVHAICEKPLASTWDDARAACTAAEQAGTVLIVGATHSYDAPVRELRRLVLDGRLGPLLGLQATACTDWRRRPRRADDLDSARGGGLVLRQGAHQIDIARLLCGGRASTVSAQTFGHADGGELGYSALLQFDSGVAASLQYSGAGGFDTAWLTQGVGELGRVNGSLDLVSQQYFPVPAQPAFAAPTFGLIVATFAAGQAVLTSRGVLVYTADGCRDHRVDGQPSGWDAVLAELGDVLDGAPALHSGRWALATLEASLAVHESARENRPVPLLHQTPPPLGR